ncbi:unnamed protein product [Onchocerca flexuosa]|uniref:RNase H domain-containing protein n=1 Tax=Onchocerca flexuosa TaxID=387005 RepID=A0A183H1K8_9BILA|nr:unnamed protein product [Onchocerca flexuosa]
MGEASTLQCDDASIDDPNNDDNIAGDFFLSYLIEGIRDKVFVACSAKAFTSFLQFTACYHNGMRCYAAEEDGWLKWTMRSGRVKDQRIITSLFQIQLMREVIEDPHGSDLCLVDLNQSSLHFTCWSTLQNINSGMKFVGARNEKAKIAFGGITSVCVAKSTMGQAAAAIVWIKGPHMDKLLIQAAPLENADLIAS